MSNECPNRPPKENCLSAKIVELELFEFRMTEVVDEAVADEAVAVCAKSMGNKDFVCVR